MRKSSRRAVSDTAKPARKEKEKPAGGAAPNTVVETRVFRSGNSDAVRLPKRFGLGGKVVRLYRSGGDRVIIEPKTRRRWPAGFLASFGRVTPDFVPHRLPPLTPTDDARAASRFGDDS